MMMLYYIYDGIINKISKEALTNIMYAYLSEHENAGKYILEYLRFGFKVGKEVAAWIVEKLLEDPEISSRIEAAKA